MNTLKTIALVLVGSLTLNTTLHTQTSPTWSTIAKVAIPTLVVIGGITGLVYYFKFAEKKDVKKNQKNKILNDKKHEEEIIDKLIENVKKQSVNDKETIRKMKQRLTDLVEKINKLNDLKQAGQIDALTWNDLLVETLGKFIMVKKASIKLFIEMLESSLKNTKHPNSSAQWIINFLAVTDNYTLLKKYIEKESKQNIQ